MEMRFPMKCFACGQRSVRYETVPLYQVEIEYDGRHYPVEVSNLEVLRCEQCKAITLDDRANVLVSAAFRRRAELLAPEQIRAGREQVGLTQEQLARYLGVAGSTLSRWETGTQIQQRSMNNLLKVFFGCRDARAVLGYADSPSGTTSELLTQTP